MLSECLSVVNLRFMGEPLGRQTQFTSAGVQTSILVDSISSLKYEVVASCTHPIVDLTFSSNKRILF